MKIELLNKENKINELTIKQREAQLENEKLVRKSLIWGLAIVLFFSFLLLIQYRQIKRANKKLAEQYAKINKQKQEITEQKEVVERQNKHINDSISYGLTIQKAMLPTEKVIKRYFETFIIYRPKDIVSGDFYWFYPNKEEMVSDTACLAAIDCTGHGVPGAFMSMIGNRLLNEIVTEKQNFNPATILDHLNKEIISTLNQEKNKNEDGMDVCLCSFKSKDNKIVFAGAKRPLFIYDNNNKDVRIVQGERKSIGGKSGRNNEIHYANKELQVNSGDILYLTSDGMIDQNGPDRKRFGSKRLIEFLKENASLDMKKQKNKLEEVFDTYTNNEEQRDDILVIGIKFF
jgi:serine phosphatase RsbU (regulator of sigma subunit)